MLDLEHLRAAIHSELGTRLEYATPANMRKFLGRLHEEIISADADQRPFVVPREHAANYEQVVAEFLSRVLDVPPERGIVILWLFASELFYARLGEQYEEELAELLTFEIQ